MDTYGPMVMVSTQVVEATFSDALQFLLVSSIRYEEH